MQSVFLRTNIFLLSLFVFLGQSELHLELVQVLIRHGERTPTITEILLGELYDTIDYEPWGIGQLTNDGKMTEYRIGTMLRQRYDHFLGSLYYPQDVYARSTDHDRTKMSLQIALAGLYPSQGVQQWNADLKWLGIPTNYVPMELDILMRSQYCPLYEVALKEARNMSEVRNEIARYYDFFEYLSEKVGWNVSHTLDIYAIYYILMSQKIMNFSLPEWCTNEVYQKLQKLVNLEYDIQSYTPQLKRLNGGFLAKKFIEHMNPKDDLSNKPLRKIYIYSGHEVNIAAFARVHNITNSRLPDYGSTFIVEKLRDEDNNFYVKIFYWTGVTQKLIPIKLKFCSEICPMETYLELMRDVIPLDKEMTCLVENITKEQLLQLYSDLY